MRRPRMVAAALAAVALSGCKDDPTGPSVTFPTLPAELVSAFCIQGNRAPAQAISGTLSSSDCPLGDGSYFEVWRIRVPSSGSYRFEASSSFDNLLGVFRLDSYSGSNASLTTIATDDDSGPGLNALIAAATLSAGTDYLLVVNGFGASDVGPYTVSFTRN